MVPCNTMIPTESHYCRLSKEEWKEGRKGKAEQSHSACCLGRFWARQDGKTTGSWALSLRWSTDQFL